MTMSGPTRAHYIAYGPASGLILWLVLRCAQDRGVVVVPNAVEREYFKELCLKEGWAVPAIVADIQSLQNPTGPVYLVADPDPDKREPLPSVLLRWRIAAPRSDLFVMEFENRPDVEDLARRATAAGFDGLRVLSLRRRSGSIDLSRWQLEPHPLVAL